MAARTMVRRRSFRKASRSGRTSEEDQEPRPRAAADEASHAGIFPRFISKFHFQNS